MRLVRLVLATAIISAYLGCLALHLGRQVVGDMSGGPLAYFFTWDMFPNYYTWSSRRTAMGKTASGKFVELYPGIGPKFRGGAGGELTRADLDRSAIGLKALAEDALALSTRTPASDPIKHVWLMEEYWPEKFNLQNDLYEDFSGQKKPDRTYWRTLSEFDVPRTGEAKAAGESP